MDYELSLKIRNAPMLNAMRDKGYNTAAELSRATGVSQRDIGAFLNLKKPAYKKDGITPCNSVISIAGHLNMGIDDLFPCNHIHNELEQNTFITQVTADDMAMLSRNMSDKDPSEILEFFEEETRRDKAIKEVLTEREHTIFCEKLYEQKKLSEIGELQGVTSSRIREIEMRAVRKVRSRLAISEWD